MGMMTLFGRPFGGTKTAVGKFVPNAAEDDEDQDDTVAEGDDEEDDQTVAEGDDDGEDDDSDTSAEDEGVDEEDDESESAEASIRSGSTLNASIAQVMSKFDMSPGAVVALEALVEGVSPAAAIRMGSAANTGVATPATRGAEHAKRRTARPKTPQASAQSTDKTAARSAQLRANIARAQGRKKEG